ncbi:betaGal beta-1,3-N-acetylglucosaminyltransferase 5B [Gossypium arboreum]|uniref:BetaGal beta-1,3-N-acetylglucosaminyltransferase 5B n=1 Tax=Gossypium arboreum TaxID=29729 RepID=A0A0B0Q3L5_GOSAR|nr:betaGal beta-1,3-N-acetylglucosaminyltransferase 5B [Gossypium arboreum]
MPHTYHEHGPTQRDRISKFLVTCHLYPRLFLRFKRDFPHLHKAYIVVLSRDVVDNDHNIIHTYKVTIRHSIHNKQ